MNNVFNSTDLANRLSDLQNSSIQDCDKNSLKHLEDLDLVSYAFPGRIDKYLDDVVNPYLFKVDDEVQAKVIKTDDGDKIWVDTNDIWDKGDLVGINIAPKDIKIIKCDE